MMIKLDISYKRYFVFEMFMPKYFSDSGYFKSKVDLLILIYIIYSTIQFTSKLFFILNQKLLKT